MREIRTSGSEGGGPNPIGPPYPYQGASRKSECSACREACDDVTSKLHQE